MLPNIYLRDEHMSIVAQKSMRDAIIFVAKNNCDEVFSSRKILATHFYASRMVFLRDDNFSSSRKDFWQGFVVIIFLCVVFFGKALYFFIKTKLN